MGALNMRLLDAIGSISKLFAEASLTKIVAGFLGAAIGYVLPTQAVVNTLVGAVSLIAFDTVTGIAASLTHGDPLQSKRFVRLLSKCLGYFSVLAAVSITSAHIPVLIPHREVMISGFLYAIMATEGISILENADRLGVKLPPILKGWLRGLKDAVEGESLPPKEGNDEESA